jgi:carbon storage regulator
VDGSELSQDQFSRQDETILTIIPRKKGNPMLVLTRKQGETIRIGDSIVIKVIAAGRGKAKIGIDAPATTRVLRGELLDALSSRPAAKSVPPVDALV